MNGWVQEIARYVHGRPDPEWEEWHWTAPDNSYQLRVCTGFDTYMMVKIDADGTRHNYGHSDSTTVKGAQCECMDKAGCGIGH